MIIILYFYFHDKVVYLMFVGQGCAGEGAEAGAVGAA